MPLRRAKQSLDSLEWINYISLNIYLESCRNWTIWIYSK